MAADARIQAHALDDLLGVQTLHLRIGVQLVEVADAQRQIGVGKELHSLRLGKAHEQRVNVRLQRALLQKLCKGVGGLHQAGILHIRTHNDAAGIQVVIQRLAFPQEFRAEENVVAMVLLPHAGREAHGDGGLDDHNGVGVILDHQLDHRFHGAGVKVVLLAVVVGGRSDDHEVRILVSGFRIQGGGQVKLLFRQILFNILILNGRLALVDQLHLFRHDVHRRHMVVLRQQRCNGKTHIAGTGNCNIHFSDAPFSNDGAGLASPPGLSATVELRPLQLLSLGYGCPMAMG